MVDGAGIRIGHVLGHLIRDVEPVHVQQIVENAYVIALEAIQLELDHKERPERPHEPVLEHVPLGDLLYQRGAKIHALRLVIGVLGEPEPLVRINLRQVHDDGAIRRWYIGHIDYPATLDRHRERLGEVRGLNHSPRRCQPAAAGCRGFDQSQAKEKGESDRGIPHLCCGQFFYRFSSLLSVIEDTYIYIYMHACTFAENVSHRLFVARYIVIRRHIVVGVAHLHRDSPHQYSKFCIRSSFVARQHVVSTMER